MGLGDMFAMAKAKNDMSKSWTDTKEAWTTWYNSGVSTEKQQERDQRSEDFAKKKEEREARKAKLTESWAANRASNQSGS